MEIGLAAVTLPARDRQHEIEPRLVGEFRQRQAVLPARRPAFRLFGGRAAGRAVGAEQPDLERVVVIHGDARLHGRGGGRKHGAILPSESRYPSYNRFWRVSANLSVWLPCRRQLFDAAASE